ncbi:DNA adenine methylase [Latilactobacillus curvatus]|uniref:DNA adenine methylase n=1 Tax=Latilactobacillus curvatus TaxID=28038 RepID=UPI0021A500CB|nr:DNA adenine methylase [Latilactobacillus curvatus]MCT2880766.1 DNA adenine methylase [Latilactobacillus curvatus]
MMAREKESQAEIKDLKKENEELKKRLQFEALKLQPFPYQGSKRKQTPLILELFPANVQCLYEPFAGSAAVSIAAEYYHMSEKCIINDIYKPLADLWKAILLDPEMLSKKYSKMWYLQQENHVDFYKKVRARFNVQHDTADFLYLLIKAAKNAIRFNSNGNFNQWLDTRRMGRKPETMSHILKETNKLLKNNTQIFATDYSNILNMATTEDLVYLDPPYLGTSTNKNPRYSQGLDFNRFLKELYKLDDKNIPFILSFDGQFGDKTYGDVLPEDLHLTHLRVDTGRSAQGTLNGVAINSIESLYVSKELVSNINPLIHEEYL